MYGDGDGNNTDGSFLLSRINFPLNFKVYNFDCDDSPPPCVEKGTIRKGEEFDVFMLGAGDGTKLKPVISLIESNSIKAFIDFASCSSFT